jgi:hypothetical protein
MWHVKKGEEIRTGVWWGDLMEKVHLEDLGGVYIE